MAQASLLSKSAWVGMLVLALAGGQPAVADPIPGGWQAQNVRPIGFSGLDGRYGAFKLAVKKADNGRWYLYIGHTFDHGWSILDVTDPRPPKGAPYKDFCAKGGRFGVHNVNQEIHLPDVEQPGNLIYAAYFNAGLRIFDISNPRTPTEVGYFMPPERTGLPDHGGAHGSPINWTEEVLVDTRGNIYICDDKWGVFILRYTGKGQPKPTAATAATAR